MSRRVILLGGYHHDALKRVPGTGCIVDPVLSDNQDKIWTMNRYYKCYPWLTSPARVFQIHRQFRQDVDYWQEAFQAYRSAGEVVVMERFPEIPADKQVLFPDVFSDWPTGFFTSTFSYMIAMAVHEGYGQIDIRGTRLEDQGEYSYQLPAILWGMDQCRKLGIQITATYEKWWRHRIEHLNVEKHFGHKVNWRQTVTEFNLRYDEGIAPNKIDVAIQRTIDEIRVHSIS